MKYIHCYIGYSDYTNSQSKNPIRKINIDWLDKTGDYHVIRHGVETHKIHALTKLLTGKCVGATPILTVKINESEMQFLKLIEQYDKTNKQYNLYKKYAQGQLTREAFITEFSAQLKVRALKKKIEHKEEPKWANSTE